MTDDEDQKDSLPVPADAKPDARPKPVQYTFTCGGANVPCKLTYTYDSDLHKRRKLPAPAEALPAPVEPKPAED